MTRNEDQHHQSPPTNHSTPQFYRIQNHPPPTHVLATKINQQPKEAIIDTKASILATCFCTFTSTPHEFHTTRTFHTASGPQNFPILEVTWTFPEHQLSIPNILTALLPCNSEHPRLIGLNLIHNTKLQKIIQIGRAFDVFWKRGA
eukprot:GHVP01033736.1.p1 GENE.GHVP01033736.1~~GHVP01033736.1.p1  ORF type:complete len:146 (+),score=17.04 GHVP01033736.1:752-1189(+)